MRFVQDQNVRFKLGNLIAHLLGLRHLIIRKNFYLAFNATPFFKLAPPVDLGDGRANDDDLFQTELITSCDHLDCFAQPLLIRQKRGGVVYEELSPRLLVVE